MRLGRVVSAVAMCALVSWVPAPAPAHAAECATSASSAALDEFFAGDGAAGLAGGDYPHVIELPDGRLLWYFQDVFIGDDAQLRGDRFAHNAALVQDGNCFERLQSPGGDGNSWLGSWVENSLSNWIWLLDAEVGADGHLWVFLAEVQNPSDRGAAPGALPVGTWTARYTLPDLRLVDMQPAADASQSLFGYSIVSDSQWSYLYGHCYRQFDPERLVGLDPDCSPHAFVARVPRGEFADELEYWDGDRWTADRDARVAVMSADPSMPVSVQRFGDVYVAASKVGGWFGSDVVVYTAPAPQGPWTESTRYEPDPRCEECNTYGAFVHPRLEGDRVTIAHSNNAWEFTDAEWNGELYRISLNAVDVPGVSAASLDRTPDLSLARADPAPTPVRIADRFAAVDPPGAVAEAIDARSAPSRLDDERVLNASLAPLEPRAGGAQSLSLIAAAVLAVLVGLLVGMPVVLGAATVRAAVRRTRRRRSYVLDGLRDGRCRSHTDAPDAVDKARPLASVGHE